MSAFSLTILARLGHAQLMPAFAGVLALDSFISAIKLNKLEINSLTFKEKKFQKEISVSLSKVFTGILWLLLQIGIGFYQGTYLC